MGLRRLPLRLPPGIQPFQASPGRGGPGQARGGKRLAGDGNGIGPGIGRHREPIGPGLGRERQFPGRSGVGLGQNGGASGRRIGLFIGAADEDRQFRFRPGGGILRGPVALPEGRQPHGHSQRREPGKALQQRGDAVAAAAVQGNRHVGAVSQDPVHQAGEHRARAHLDEGMDPGVGHGGDGGEKIHRLRQLAAQAAALAGRIGLIRCGGGARVDPGPGRREVVALQEGRERHGGARDLR